MTTLDRIKKIAENEGIKIYALEDKIGASRGVLSKAIAKNTDIQAKWLQKIASVFPMYSTRWLLLGEGDMLCDNYQKIKAKPICDNYQKQNTDMSNEKKPCVKYEQEIPLYDIHAAAGSVELFQHLHSQNPIGTIKVPNLSKCDGAIFVRGDSMYPIISSGDIVLYKELPNLETIVWGETYVISYEIEGDYYTVVKCVQPSTENPENIILTSHNEFHQPYEIHLSQVKAMALVRASIKYNGM